MLSDNLKKNIAVFFPGPARKAEWRQHLAHGTSRYGNVLQYNSVADDRKIREE